MDVVFVDNDARIVLHCLTRYILLKYVPEFIIPKFKKIGWRYNQNAFLTIPTNISISDGKKVPLCTLVSKQCFKVEYSIIGQIPKK